MTFKDGMRSKRVEIHRVTDYNSMRVYLFRRTYVVTIADLMLRHFSDLGVEQYLSEYTLISQLLDKINRTESVKNRWIPTFAPPLRHVADILNQELEVPLIGSELRGSGWIHSEAKDLGQWFLLLLTIGACAKTSRDRNRFTNSNILRVLVYAASAGA